MRKKFFALKKAISHKSQAFHHMMKNQKGQGTAEYVLLLAIVAGMLLAFGPRIKKAIENKMGGVEAQMNEIGGG